MNPPRKKRRFRFSLRTMLVMVTVFCVLLGWKVHQVSKQKRVVEWLEENGGTGLYDYEVDENGEWIADAEPPGPEWLRGLVGVDCFAEVVVVILQRNEVTNLSLLATLPKLRRLDLFESPDVTDLSPLANLTNLKYLELHGTQVSDISPLAKLTNLEELSLGDTQVSDLSPLAKLTNLESLHLLSTHVCELLPLTKLTRLKNLVICDTQVDDLSPLTNMTELETLLLHCTPIDDLSPLTNLTKLKGVLVGPNVSDKETARLQKALPNCVIEQWPRGLSTKTDS